MSMILAEKITALRRRKGWSQEELAMQLGISRQSVSKWESASSVPDLDKIIKLSEIFSVSTDLLLKDEFNIEAKQGVADENSSGANGGFDSANSDETAGSAKRHVSAGAVEEYVEETQRAAKRIAAGVSLCILSPVILLFLSGLSVYGNPSFTEDMAAGFGVTILLLMVASAVCLFIVNGLRLDKFQYFEQEQLSVDNDILENIRRQKEAYEYTYRTSIAVGVVLCIVSAVPIMVAAAFSSPDYTYIFCVDILLVIVALAVNLLIRAGMRMECFKKILQEEDYSFEQKEQRRKTEPFAGIYWSVVTAIYLAVSFWSMRWGQTWIIWPCAGVLFAAVSGIINIASGKR